MSETPRPRQVTWACVIAGVTSGVLLANFVTMLSDWVPQELRQQVETLAGEPPLSNYDVDVRTMIEWLRIALMVGSAVAVSAIILAIHTARRNRGARIGLTIIAGIAAVVFLLSGVVGVLPAGLSAACIGLLWSRDSNAWFRPDKAAAATRTASADVFAPPSTQESPSTPQTHPVSDQQPAAAPRPADVPFGTRPDAPAQQRTWPTPPASRGGAPPRRNGVPGVLLAAVIVTIIMSAAVGFGTASVLVTYAGDPTQLGGELLSYPTLQDNPQIESLGWTEDGLGRAVLYVMAGLLVLSLCSIAAALWLLRRSRAARVVLVVLSGVTIAVAVAGTLIGIPWLAAAIVVLVLMFRPTASAYLDSARN